MTSSHNHPVLRRGSNEKTFIASTILVCVFAGFLLVAAFYQDTPAKFYYAFNEKIPIQALENKIVVRYAASKPGNAVKPQLFQASALELS